MGSDVVCKAQESWSLPGQGRSDYIRWL
jgi:hypothetical protein